MPEEKEPHAGPGAGNIRKIRREWDRHTLRLPGRHFNNNPDVDAGRFPGIDLDGHTLAEIRRKVRDMEGDAK
ncbi:MAG: hypothetical protein LUE17_05365 [Planctomycetaceae bacterium]|nr:hypothetical protein [Planctomycetaceae bacterium]